MPNTREKLIELLNQGADMTHCTEECWDKKCNDCIREAQADHLIANGVTIATDNNKWIPVTERLPEDTANVLVHTLNGWIGSILYINNRGFEDCGVKVFVTHWMPLPEPPKGE